MLTLQAALVVLAVIGAAASVRLREPRPTGGTLIGAFAPGKQTIRSSRREYELPFRGAKQPLILVPGRQVVILLRTLVIAHFRLVIMSIAIAVPIGILIGSDAVRLSRFPGAGEGRAFDSEPITGPEPAQLLHPLWSRECSPWPHCSACRQ